MGKKLVEKEAARTAYTKQAMTDSGDNTVFTLSGVTIFSGKSGYTPDVLPDGVKDTLNVLAASTVNDSVKVNAFTAQLAGVEYDVSAETLDISGAKPTGSFAKWVSIQLDSDGSTVNIVAGTEAADLTFLTTRGTGAGQIPYAVVGDIELGCVKLVTSAAGLITESQIVQVANTYQDRVNYPIVKTKNNIGMGRDATVAAKKNAYIEFDAALEPKYTGALPKAVYITANSVTTFSAVTNPYDFVINSETPGQGSQATYSGVVSFKTDPTLNQGSFSVVAKNGISDPIAYADGQVETFRMWPDEDEDEYWLQQVEVSAVPSYPTSGPVTMDITLTGDKSVPFLS